MPDIEVNIELYCATCNAGICGNGTFTKRRQQPCLDVQPCEACLKSAVSQAFDEGFREAREKYDVG